MATAAAAKKAFADLTKKMLTTPRWTLADYKTQLSETMKSQDWKIKYIPGVSSSPDTKRFKDEVKVLDALQEDELEDRSIIKTLRLMRISKQTDKSGRFIRDVLERFDQLCLMQRWLKSEESEGRPIPESYEEAQDRMSHDPDAQHYAQGSRAMETYRRRELRRAGRGRGG